MIIPIFYGLAAAAFLALFITNGRFSRKLCRSLLVLGVTIHLVYMITRWIGEGHIPIATETQAMSFFVLAIVLVFLYLEFRFEKNVIGIFIMIIALSFQIPAAFHFSPFAPIKPILRSQWFAIHAGSSILSFASLAISAWLSILYLLLFREIRNHEPGYFFQRIPSLEALDEMAYKSVMLGFFLLTVGIGSGVIWASQAWGHFWTWDPKQASALVVWLVYAGYLHARLVKGWEGRRVALFATFGFATLIFTFVVVNLLFKTSHRFL